MIKSKIPNQNFSHLSFTQTKGNRIRNRGWCLLKESVRHGVRSFLPLEKGLLFYFIRPALPCHWIVVFSPLLLYCGVCSWKYSCLRVVFVWENFPLLDKVLCRKIKIVP